MEIDTWEMSESLVAGRSSRQDFRNRCHATQFRWKNIRNNRFTATNDGCMHLLPLNDFSRNALNTFSFRFICLLNSVWSAFQWDRVRSFASHNLPLTRKVHFNYFAFYSFFSRFFFVFVCFESNVTEETIKVFSIKLQPHWQQPEKRKT